LVGTWIETRETGQLSYAGTSFDISGAGGLVVTFSSEGQEAANYADAKPLTGRVAGAKYVLTRQGSANYQVSTYDGRLMYMKADVAELSQTATLAGKPVKLLPGVTSPVSYTCGRASLAESSGHFGAIFRRA
jgi:TctA family transporter